jgi:hypothetical protein
MTGLELVLALVGVAVTILVVVGMVLIVPGGLEAAPAHTADPVPPDRPAVVPVPGVAATRS